MPIRYDNPHEIGPDRLVNAVAGYDKVGGPCVVVDFGTAVTYDVVSAAGEYLGGIIFPGVEIAMEALTERAAALPKIELGTPRALIGKTTIDAIRAGTVYGYAGMVDGILARLRKELGQETQRARHRRPRERDRAVLRVDRGGRRPAHAHGPEADLGAQPGLDCVGMRSLREPWTLGGLTIPNRVVLAPLAGIGNWFVRLQAKRYGAGLAVSEMVSSFAVHYGNRKTLDELLVIHPDERAGGPVSVQLFGHDPEIMRSAAATVARAGADLIDLNMGCPVPKVCKTGAGAALLGDPDTRGGGRARRARGLRAPGHREAARRPQAGGDARASRSRTGSSRRRAWRASASTRARPPCATRARPTTTSPRSSSRRCRCR